jgi:hypothetical protein
VEHSLGVFDDAEVAGARTRSGVSVVTSTDARGFLDSFVIYADVEYLLFGNETGAIVTKTKQVRNRVQVEYRFTDADGIVRTGKDTTAVGWVVPQGGAITIQYLPGQGGHTRLSRLIVHWLPYAFFIGSGLLLLLTLRGVRSSHSDSVTGRKSGCS